MTSDRPERRPRRVTDAMMASPGQEHAGVRREGDEDLVFPGDRPLDEAAHIGPAGAQVLALAAGRLDQEVRPVAEIADVEDLALDDVRRPRRRRVEVDAHLLRPDGDRGGLPGRDLLAAVDDEAATRLRLDLDR